jgi:transmembrane sensor
MAGKEELLPEDIRLAAMEWRIRIDNDIVDEADLVDFQEWRDADPRHAGAYDRAATLWSAHGTLDKGDISADLLPGRPGYWRRLRLPKALLAAFARRPAFTQRPAFTRHPAFAGGIGAFAVLMLAMIGGLQLIQKPATTQQESAANLTAYATATGELREVMLSDRSMVTLGPGSEIQVAMSVAERRVKFIRGAALFNVTKDADRPFFVDAEDFSVRVLGTVFDMGNNGGVLRLSVSEGRVEAAYPYVIYGKPTTMTTRRELRAGQAVTATADGGLSTVSEYSLETFASWRESRLKYQDAHLSELIADANRYSDRPIVLDPGIADIDDVKVTFSFNGNNVERMLSALPDLFPVEVDWSSATEIVIRAADNQP